MDEKLYRLVDNKYVEVPNIFFNGYPKEGLWMVKRIQNGNHWGWLIEEAGSLPDAISIASFEMIKNDIRSHLVPIFEHLIEPAILDNNEEGAVDNILKAILTVIRKEGE